MENKKLKTIGSEEWCAFNELNIPAINARIDSGAKTSSIQADEIKVVKKNDEKWVRFIVYPIQGSHDVKVKCKAKLVSKRSIKSSQGISEKRYIIKSPVTLGEDTFEIELSLAKRKSMEFRMLLGREAMNGRYLINPAETHLQKSK